MKWQDIRLTTDESDAALKEAGIDPDPKDWDEATLDRASEVLEQAVRVKMRRYIEYLKKIRRLQ